MEEDDHHRSTVSDLDQVDRTCLRNSPKKPSVSKRGERFANLRSGEHWLVGLGSYQNGERDQNRERQIFVASVCPCQGEAFIVTES